MKRTERGFGIYTEFADAYGNAVRVQRSSNASKRCVWIFSHYPDGSSAKLHLGQWEPPAPHLTVAQAKRVIRALTRFVEGKE